MKFVFDNVYGVYFVILQVLVDCNDGVVGFYGVDLVMVWVEVVYCEVLDVFDVVVCFVVMGMVVNVLVCVQLLFSYGWIYCYQIVYIYLDECVVLEFFLYGVKLVLIVGEQGCIVFVDLVQVICIGVVGGLNDGVNVMVLIINVIEWGICYIFGDVVDIV